MPTSTPTGELEEFRLVKLLGRGGMGEVYLGHDTVLDRAVAIKLIGSRTPAASRERFLIEARAVARLSHPNVVTIFRVGTTGDGRPFLVQELIRGRSLDQIVRPVAPRHVLELAIGIARGLDAAHRRGILHRDVKPANVMLDEHGTPRLLDFGLAKLTGAPLRVPEPSVTAFDDSEATPDRPTDPDATRDRPPAAISPLGSAPTPSQPSLDGPARVETPAPTSPSSVLGTPRYTAPEIWRGEAATVRSDLYSLGVMLYELASGTAPYPQTDVAELRQAAIDGGARTIDELAPELAPILARLITRCLALDPMARPVSAAAVVHELEAALADAPVISDGNPYRGLRSFSAEHRGVFFGRGADVSLLVDRLRTESLLVVAGDSGIGKSSVCHAGVVPAVISGALADRRRWRAKTIVPGRRPWDALRDALGIDDDGNPAAIVRGLRPAEGEGLLIVIDQLEELITLADARQAARVAEMLAAIADGVPGVKALLAVRGDFLTRVGTLPELGGPLTRALHLLRVLSPTDLREAVVGPARAMGVAFETGAMIDKLVDAVAEQPGALPLLQFTLCELWQRRDPDRGVIPEHALAALGGVDGGLAGHADAVLLELGAEQRAAARHIVLRLVTAAHTRTVRDRDELVGDDRSAAALESLVRGRLVVARDALDGTPSYELAHEALIRSWGTLRDWLDAAAGQHAARNRVIASAAEWHRLGRRSDQLWSGGQLDDARGVFDLTPVEREFVAASRALVRRRRLARIAALAALPVIVLVMWAGFRIAAARQRDRVIGERVAAANGHRERGDRLAANAARAREAAFARFDANVDGEQQWREASRLGTLAHAAYADAATELDAAHLVDGGAMRGPMAHVLARHAELAEAERDRARVDELLRRLVTYDPAARAPWFADGRLVVELDRTARISVHARRTTPGPAMAGGFDATPIAIHNGARLDLALAPGSYVVVVTTPDVVVRDPIVIERGGRIRRAIEIPPARSVPAGFVYVPAGRFLYGSDDDEAMRTDFLHAPPLHEVTTEAYLIERTEVTFGEWLAYLRELPPDERDVRRPSIPTVTLADTAGKFTLLLQPNGTRYRAVEGELLHYQQRSIRADVHWERLPVSGISWEDALAYTAWLDRSGRVPRARPCTHLEWERAARGADGRAYPHADALAPDAANIDLTYGRNPLAFGPDEVGSFPASDSPFGVADLAGNVWELVRGPRDEVWIKGGSWYQGSLTARANNHNTSEPTQRLNRIGFRVCATPGSRAEWRAVL